MSKHAVLVVGKPAKGKSMSLRNLSKVLYANCESGKRLPFSDTEFKEVVITNPEQHIRELFDYADNMVLSKENPFSYLAVDGLNYLMDMYESVHVRTATNTMNAWGNYAEFFRNMMQQRVSVLDMPIVFTAHTRTIYNESEMSMETRVPIKGALANQGIESYFSIVVASKSMRIADLEGYENDLLTITDRERRTGLKYVFQTQLTADTVNETIRSPLDMFSEAETFIDNDVQLVFNRLTEYYGS